MNSKGKFAIGTGTVAILIVAALAIGYIYMYGLPTLSVTPTSTPAKQLVTCNSTTSPELKLVVLDEINTGTLRTNSFDANVFLNGAYNGGYHLTDDTTVDVSPGDGYSVWFKQSGGSTTYFGYQASGNVPCEELTTINAKSTTVGTLTFTATNPDDGLANSETDQVVMGTGESVSVDFALKEATADACIGSPYANKDLLLCFDYNSNVLKAPTVKLNGANLPAVSAPSGHSAVRTTNAGPSLARNETACFTITGVKSICDYAKVDGFTLSLEAKASTDPGLCYSDLNANVYMPQVFQQADTGAFDWYYTDAYNATTIITPLKGNVFLT